MMDPKVEAEYEEYMAAGRIWGVIDKENIKKIKFPRVPKEIVDGFKALEDDLTGTVSDILDALGYNKVIPANVLPPIEPGHLIVGTAVTLRSIPIEKTTDAGGMTEMSSMGGQSFVSAKIRGLEGVVIDGAVRDVGEIRKYGVPTWCRGATPKTGKCRIEAMEINGPVVLAGIQINPGDLIIADDSGICAVPPQHAAYVLKKCQEILPDEEVMRELIERDAPISEIKKLFRKRYTDDDNPNTQR